MIDIEHIETWPNEVRKLLDENFELLRNYEIERVRLDELRERDYFAYARVPGNKYGYNRRALVERAASLAFPHDIASFHCTRLCPDEIDDIRTNGMTLPSPEFAAARIKRRVLAGDLTIEVAGQLKSRNMASDQYRRGMLWFVSGKSILRDESGLFRLFRFWGGEALYGLYEHDATVAPILRSLGQPCIVATALNVEAYAPFGFPDALSATFMRSKGIPPDRSSSSVEGNVKAAVPAARILSVIEFSNPEFETLTKSSQWHLSIS